MNKNRRSFLKGIATAGVTATVVGFNPVSLLAQRKVLKILPAPDPGAVEDKLSPEAEALILAAHSEAGESVDKALESIVKSDSKQVNTKAALAKAGLQLKGKAALGHAKTMPISPGLQKKRKAARTKGWHVHATVSLGTWHSHVSW